MYSRTGELNIIKMSILSELISRFDANQTEIPSGSFGQPEKLIMHLYENEKVPEQPRHLFKRTKLTELYYL